MIRIISVVWAARLRFCFRCLVEKQLPQKSLIAAAIIPSIALLGCGKQESKTVHAELAATEPKSAANPTPGIGGTVTKLDGHWVPDKEKMLKIYQEAIAAKTGSAAIDPAVMANVTQIVEGVLALMFVQIENGKSRVYSPRGIEESDFKVLTSDESTGEFTVQSTSTRSGVKKSVCKLEGNTLTLTVDSNSLVLRRIDQGEFEQRKKLIESGTTSDASPDTPVATPPSTRTAGETR